MHLLIYRNIFVILLGLALTITVKGSKGLLIFHSDEIPKSVFYSADHKKMFILTKTNVYQIYSGKTTLIHKSDHPIYCGYASDTALWIGVDNGIDIINLNTLNKSFVHVDTADIRYRVVSIFKNADKKIYIGTDAYGLYIFHDKDASDKISTVFPINKVVSTADSSVWIGTDVGLFKKKNNDWIRYNEEGVSNFEIPDNIVQNLVVDNTGLLWVLMRDGVTVIETPRYHSDKHYHEDEHGHLPSTEYLGRAQNTVYDIHYYKNNGYLFSTEMGLLFMRVGKGVEVSDHFHHSSSDKIEIKKLLTMPDATKITDKYGKVIFIEEQGNKNTIICERGVYTLSSKELNNLLK